MRFGWMLLCILCVSLTASAAEPDLPAVGDEQHLWVLLPAADDGVGWDLVHAGSRTGVPEYRVVRRFDTPPAAMCALDRTLWLVFPGASQATTPRFEFYRVQADFQPSVDLYVMEPREGLGMLPPIDGVTAIVRCIGTKDGPLVVARSAQSDSDDAALIGRQLSQGRWEPVSLPKALSELDPVLGAQTDRGVLLAQPSGAELSTWRRDREGGWIHHRIAGVSAPMALVDVDGQPLLVHQDDSAMLQLSYIQDDELWPLAHVPLPQEPWMVVGRRGGVRVVSEQSRSLSVVDIDAMNGQVAAPILVEPMSMIGTGLWSIAIAVGLASAVILVIVLARGGDLSSMVVPEGWAVLPPLPRLGALCIDLIPGFCIFFLLADGDWRQLVRVPLMSLSSLEFGSYILLVLATVLWCGVFEAWVGSTPGKWVVGGAVRATDGGPPSKVAVCIRNMMKGFVLLVPPLAVLTLLHPNQQSVGDLMARTLVVRKRPSIEPDQG